MASTVREVMSTDPVTVTSNTPLERVAELMRDHDIGSLPVVDEGRLTGVLTDRDIVVRCVALGRHPAGTLVGEMASQEMHVVRPDDSTKVAAKLMREHTLRRLPVIDDGSQLAGMVSIGDLARIQDPESPLADISSAPPNT